MKKMSQRGFSLVGTVLILVIIGIVAFTLWYVFNAKGNTDKTLGTAANTQTEVSKKPAKAPAPASTAKIIQSVTSAKFGQYLADPNGKPLYTYASDTKGVSNCTGACLDNWPIYKAGATTGLPANITVANRSDGSSQYAYKDQPLYYYSADPAGQVTGDGLAGFHVAKP
jgi:predicted lipoprotein with Yx(FWY)xxD motif